MIYRKAGCVPASMCDAATKLSPLALFQLEEDAVTELMGDLHIDGLTAMREYGAMWVFVKNVIKVFRRPEWREEFELRSFVSGHSAAKLLIDTELSASITGEALAHSRLELCALDLQIGSIRKAATVGVTDATATYPALPDLSFSRFPKKESAAVETVTVRSTNLDYCSHTNNIEYIRFILNTYHARHLMENEIGQIEVHYGQQTFEGNAIQIMKYNEGTADFFTLRSDDKVAAECRIDWK